MTNCRSMRHDCEKHGCFEKKYRCQLGKLDHLLPGGNGFTDIDGFCHINGHNFYIEWKTGFTAIAGKQKDALYNLSMNAPVVIAYGDPITMMPDTIWIVRNGNEEVITQNANDKFKLLIKQWGVAADEMV